MIAVKVLNAMMAVAMAMQCDVTMNCVAVAALNLPMECGSVLWVLIVMVKVGSAALHGLLKMLAVGF